MNYIDENDDDEDLISNEENNEEIQEDEAENEDNLDSDDDNSDNDEDDDDEDYDNPNKKRRKGHGQQRLKKKVKEDKQFSAKNFYEYQAEEDSEEESNDGDDDLIDNKQARLEREMINRRKQELLIQQPHRHTPAFINMQPQEAEEYFENKYQQQEYESQIRSKEISYLPSINDPKMFAVRCKPGSESEIVMILMNKYLHFLREKQELLIYSCSYLPKFKGYVYIEAEKMAFVIEAISDIKDVYKNNSIKIIPVNEVPQLFVPEQQNQLQQFQWVRIKHGLYENDLAQIVNIEENWKYYTLKLIPRIKVDIEEERREAKEGRKSKLNSKQKIRPEKKLFNGKEHIGVEKKLQNEEVWRNQSFYKGFLHKRFNAANIDHENIIPTIDEVEAFLAGEQVEEDKYKMWDSMQKQVYSMKNQIHNFQKGDRIIVVAGEQKNLSGVVIETQKDQIYIQRDGLKNQLILQPMELRKDFQIGQHVTILDGVYKNYNGTITNISNMIAKIILDNQNKEVKIFVNDLKLWNSNLTTTNINKFTFLKLHQANTVCVVLQSFQDSLKVIDNAGQIQTIQYYQIDKELNDQRSSVRNKQKQLVAIDANVKVLEGINKGKIAQVKHLYYDILFLYNQEFSSTFGIFVENVNNCIVITESYNQVNSKFSAKGVKKDSLIGKMITICKGAWKGYQGKVINADSKTVRIELSCKCKTITIGRAEATGDVEINEDNDRNMIEAMQTPAYNTPGHQGMQSPAWGETPAYEPNKRY